MTAFLLLLAVLTAACAASLAADLSAPAPACALCGAATLPACTCHGPDRR